MTEPGDDIAAGAGGRGQLRASHAEREQVIDLLKAAFVQGRLAIDELDQRVGWALTSRTCAQLAALTADIPAGLTGAQPPQPTRKSGNKKASAAVLGSIAVWWSTQVAVSFWVGDSGPAKRLLGMVIVAVLLQVSILSAWLIAVRLERRAGRSAKGLSPGGSGQASQRPESTALAGQLPQINRCCRMVPPRRCLLAEDRQQAAADADDLQRLALGLRMRCLRIDGPLARVNYGQSRLLTGIEAASSAALAAVRHTPSTLVIRLPVVRLPVIRLTATSSYSMGASRPPSQKADTLSR